jgi:hypothetical protein
MIVALTQCKTIAIASLAFVIKLTYLSLFSIHLRSPARIQWVNIFTNKKNIETAQFYEKVLGWQPEYCDFSEQWLEIKGPENVTNIALHPGRMALIILTPLYFPFLDFPPPSCSSL